MRCLSLKLNKTLEKDVSDLYLSAFPDNERPPLFWFLKCFYECDKNEIFAYYEDSFIGFIEITTHRDIAYICYFAVTKNKRNLGYGTKILKDIKEKYKNYTILLCFEEVDEKYPDYNTRLHRKNFYLRNGFIENNLKTQEGEVIYQSAYHGQRKVNFQEYVILFDQCYGKGASNTYLKEVK